MRSDTQRQKYLNEHQDAIRGIGGLNRLNERLDLASVSAAALGFVLIGPELIPMHDARGPDSRLAPGLHTLKAPGALGEAREAPDVSAGRQDGLLVGLDRLAATRAGHIGLILVREAEDSLEVAQGPDAPDQLLVEPAQSVSVLAQVPLEVVCRGSLSNPKAHPSAQHHCRIHQTELAQGRRRRRRKRRRRRRVWRRRRSKRRRKRRRKRKRKRKKVKTERRRQGQGGAMTPTSSYLGILCLVAVTLGRSLALLPLACLAVPGGTLALLLPELHAFLQDLGGVGVLAAFAAVDEPGPAKERHVLLLVVPLAILGVLKMHIETTFSD